METSSEVHWVGLNVVVDILEGLGPDDSIIRRIFANYVGQA